MNDNERREEYDRTISEANKAKDVLYEIAQKLESLGYIRKSQSCMTLVHTIETWQNRR